MTSREEIFAEFKKLLETQFEIDPNDVTLQSSLYEDLDLDSIDAVDMIVYIQKKTNTKIQPEEFKSVKTVEDVVNIIAKILKIEE